MRTNIVIDEQLIREAMSLTGVETKREVVTLALQTLVRLKRQSEMKRFRGTLTWDGDLDDMRLAR